MNLILTKDCAKECSFCFTGEKSKGSEMSLTTISKILKQFPLAEIRLLGGEPTQHSRFSDIIALLKSSNRPYLLVSNMLFSNKTKDVLLDYPPKWLLCNGMELDEKNRMTLFNKNWNSLSEVTQLDLAITLSESTSIGYIKEYLGYLTLHLGQLKSIRIGLDLSGNYLINNTSIGGMIDYIGNFLKTSALKQIPKYVESYMEETNNRLLDHLFRPETLNYNLKFDCQIPPCIFDNTPHLQFNNSGMSSICNKTALDVFGNGSVIHCYQASDIKLDNIFDYSNEEDAANAMRVDYKSLEKSQEIHTECQKCKYYLYSHCNGLCLGCRDLGATDHVIPINIL